MQVEEDLLRAVVTVVVDVDSCSDPTDDERNSTSYQIEPKGTYTERHSSKGRQVWRRTRQRRLDFECNQKKKDPLLPSGLPSKASQPSNRFIQSP